MVIVMKIIKITALTLIMGIMLSACEEKKLYDVDGTKDAPSVTKQGTEGAQQFSVVFDLETKSLPTVTDFLTAYPTDAKGKALNVRDTDGTFYMDGGNQTALLKKADGSFEVDDNNSPKQNPKYNPAYNALDQMAGFSTTQPFYIPLTQSIDPASVADGKGVYVQAINYKDESPIKAENPDFSDLFDDSETKKAVFKVEVTSFADAGVSNSILKVTPTRPLAPDTRYLVVLTTSIKDTQGNRLMIPFQYDFFAGNKPLPDDPQAGAARVAIKNWKLLSEGLFISKLRRSRNDVVMGYTFVTNNPLGVMNSIVAPGNFKAELKDTVFDSTPKSRSMDFSGKMFKELAQKMGVSRYGLAGTKFLFTSKLAEDKNPLKLNNTKTIFGHANLYLPYLLEAPKGAYIDDNIMPTDDDQVHDGKFSGYASCKKATPPSNINSCLQSQLSAANTILGRWKADQSRSDVTAISNNVSFFQPFPKSNGLVNVPVLIVLPSENKTICRKPANGWPVTIYQHDLMRDRMDAVAYAEKLSEIGQCRAVVAIDLPLHGPMPKTVQNAIGENKIPLLATINESQTGDTLNITAQDQFKAMITARTLFQRHFGLTKESSSFAPAAASESQGESGSLFLNYLHFQTLRDNIRQSVLDLMNLSASLKTTNVTVSQAYNTILVPQYAPRSLNFDVNDVTFVGAGLGGFIGAQFVALNNANLRDDEHTDDANLHSNDNGNSALVRIKAATFIDTPSGLVQVMRNGTLGQEMVRFYTTPKDQGGPGLVEDSNDFKTLMYVFQSTIDSADTISYIDMLKKTNTPYIFLNRKESTTTPSLISGFPMSGSAAIASRAGAHKADLNTDLSTMNPVRIQLNVKKDRVPHGMLNDNKAAGYDAISRLVANFLNDVSAGTLNAGSAGANTILDVSL